MKSNTTLWMIGALLALFSSISSALSVWDAVNAANPLNARSSPSLSGAIITEIQSSTKGTVVTGPFVADGYTWWYVFWKNGTWGYSAETSNLQYFPPEALVYGDELGLGWRENGWSNVTSSFTSSTRRYGNYGIATNTSDAYGRLYLRTNGIYTGGYNSVRFSVMTPSSNGKLLWVGIYNTSGTVIKNLALWDYVSGGNLSSNTWYDVRIPLSDLLAANQTIGGFVVESGTPSTFYVDDVGLDTVSGSTFWTPWSPTVSQAPSDIFSDNLSSGWVHSSWPSTAVNFMSPSAYRGERGIEVSTLDLYGRLHLFTDASHKFYAPGSADTLSFAVNIGKYEGENLYVGVIGTEGTVVHNIPVAPYTGSGTLDAYQWQPVSIPLTALWAGTMDIYGIAIESANPSTFLIDEIRFETSGGMCNVQ